MGKRRQWCIACTSSLFLVFCSAALQQRKWWHEIFRVIVFFLVVASFNAKTRITMVMTTHYLHIVVIFGWYSTILWQRGQRRKVSHIVVIIIILLQTPFNAKKMTRMMHWLCIVISFLSLQCNFAVKRMTMQDFLRHHFFLLQCHLVLKGRQWW